MKRINKIFTLLALPILAFSVFIACSSEEDGDVPPELTKGSLELSFDNKVGNSELVLNSETYSNSSGEDYSVSKFKFLISNIVLIDADGNEFVYPKSESYFIINESDPASTKIQLSNIQGGDYKAIRFGVGVPQSEYPLEGANFIPEAEPDMLWPWSAGFIFLKIEGEYTSDDTTQFKTFAYHMGSHGTNQDNYREVVLQFPQILKINDQVQAKLVLKTDVSKIFDSENTLSLDEKSSVQVDPVYAPQIADNFQTAFSVLTAENPNNQ
jgi:hypothetical protein